MSEDKISIAQYENRIKIKIKKIINAFGKHTNYSVDPFYTGQPYTKITKKKRDYINGLINPLSKCKAILDTEIKEYATGEMFDKILLTIENLEYFISQIEAHKDENTKSNNLKYVKNDFLIDNCNNFFSFTKKDVYILGYYELIKLYKDNGIVKEFKKKAIQFINYNFAYSLAGDTLCVSLLEITHNDSTLSLSDEQYKELKKLDKIIFPTMKKTI